MKVNKKIITAGV